MSYVQSIISKFLEMNFEIREIIQNAFQATELLLYDYL